MKKKLQEMIKPGYWSGMKFFKLCIYLALVISAVYFFAYQWAETPNPEIDNNAVVLTFESVDKDGKTFEVTPEKRYAYDENRVFEMKTTLPEGIRDDYLGFLAFQNVQVLVGGREIFSYNMHDTKILGGAVKYIHHFVQLDPSCSGQEATIRLSYYGGRNSCLAPAVMFGTGSEIYRMIFRKYGPPFVMGLVLMVVSAVVLIFCLLMQRRRKAPAIITSLCVAVMVTAGWIVMDSYFYPFLFRHNHADGLMSYLLCMLMPSPFIFYLAALQEGRYSKLYTVLQILIKVNFIVFLVLHLTGIFKFYDALMYIDTLLAALIVVIAVIMVKEIRGGYFRNYRFTATGLICFMVCGVVEIFFVMMPNLYSNNGGILIGLMLLLGFAVAQQMDDYRVVDTERQRALELSQTKTSFLANMSHEIRTPIYSILGMNDLILREEKDPAIRSYAGTIKRSGKMLVSLIDDVLDFSRIEAGKMEIVKDEYRLPELLADISTMAAEQAEQKGLKFEMHIQEGMPAGMYSDEVRIKQILLNLLSNAVKYTDEGSVTIDAGGEYTDDETFNLRFAMKDTGRGIREQDLKNLFQAFNRNDLKRNRSIEGTGLGLAIVKRITDAMDGTVEVESEYGKGSTFTVTLPQLVTDHSKTPVTQEGLREVSMETRRERAFVAPEAAILAVDDNRPNLSIVSAFLRDTMARVDLCADGNTALEKCKENEYDLILLDHMMPEPDGIQTLKMIREDAESKNRETPVVVLTANAVAGSRKMYLETGFADYLSKPLDASVLEKTVKKFLPAEKIRKPEESGTDGDDGIMEFDAAGPDTASETKLPERIRSIRGIDAEAAMKHTGGDPALLEEILKDIADQAEKTAADVRRSAAGRDWDKYRITAHSMKSLAGTIGAEEMFDEARRHENAARDAEYSFIEEKSEGLARDWEKLCAEIRKAVKD